MNSITLNFDYVRKCLSAVRGDIGFYETGGFTIRTPTVELLSQKAPDREPKVWLDGDELYRILDAVPFRREFELVATDHKTAPNVVTGFDDFQVLCKTTSPSSEAFGTPEEKSRSVAIPRWLKLGSVFGRHLIEIHEDSVRANFDSGQVGWMAPGSALPGSGYAISSEFGRAVYDLTAFLQNSEFSRDDEVAQISGHRAVLRGPCLKRSSTPDLSVLEPEKPQTAAFQIRPWKLGPLDVILDKHTIGQDEWALEHWNESGWWLVSELDARANVQLKEDTDFEENVTFHVSARRFGQAIRAANSYGPGTPTVRFWTERQPIQITCGEFECYLAQRTRP